MSRVTGWVGDRVAWWQATRPGRTMARFGRRRGSVIAGGIAYFAVFSLFPALALGFTVFGIVLDGNDDLQQDVARYLNEALGVTLISLTEGDGGVVPMSALTSTASLSTTGIVGVLLLLWAGLGWLSAMGAGIQAMFDITPSGNLAKKKAIDLVMLVVLGVAVLASTIGGIVVTSAGDWAARTLGLGESSAATWATTVVSLLVILAVNVVIFLLLFKLEARIGLRVGDLWSGALLGAAGMVALQYFAKIVFEMAGNNEFLAAFAVVIGLLLWMNFAGRIVLLAGAWAAEVADERGRLRSAERAEDRLAREHDERTALAEGRDAAAGRAPATVPGRDPGGDDTGPPSSTPVWPVPRPGHGVRGPGSVPAFGPRSADRATVAAGFVLGATAATGFRVIRAAGRALVPSRRP